MQDKDVTYLNPPPIKKCSAPAEHFFHVCRKANISHAQRISRGKATFHVCCKANISLREDDILPYNIFHTNYCN